MIERMRSRVSEGMSVRSADGEKLGKVVACQPSGFVVEKGFLFPKDLLVPYERVSGIANGEIVLTLARAELGAEVPAKGAVTRAKEAIAEAVSPEEGNGHARRKGETLGTFGTAGEICVQLTEEEIVAGKRVEKVGEVHVKKEIITEEKQITVPVTREVIRVERVAVSHEAHAEDHPFEEVSYEIPIREEHVTIEKHSVVHEELRIGKEIQRGEETASATVRRERAEVETLGPVRRAEGPAEPSLRPTGTGGR
jgi:uncharacterized protein (TIGR02271 family)